MSVLFGQVVRGLSAGSRVFEVFGKIYSGLLKGTATLKANESEMQALIKTCILPQTQSKSSEK